MATKIEITVYTFDELSHTAQDVAIRLMIQESDYVPTAVLVKLAQQQNRKFLKDGRPLIQKNKL